MVEMNRKLSIHWRICFTFLLFVSVLLFPNVLAGNDDGDDEEVSVWWIKDYNGNGDDLTWSQYNAEGFYNTMYSAGGWTKVDNKGDSDAHEDHFEMSSVSGSDSDYVDDVDFVWFDGHGSYCQLLFEDDNDGDGTNYTECLYHTEASWGDRDLEWMAVAACAVLPTTMSETYWGDAFNGLHIMLGFHTVRSDDPIWLLKPILYTSAGTVFANHMINDEYQIVWAWEVMTGTWQSSDEWGSYLSVTANEYEYLPGIKTGVEDDDDDPEYFRKVKWQC